MTGQKLFSLFLNKEYSERFYSDRVKRHIHKFKNYNKSFRRSFEKNSKYSFENNNLHYDSSFDKILNEQAELVTHELLYIFKDK